MELKELEAAALHEINAAADVKQLELVRVKYLGRNGELTKVLRSLSGRPLAERKDVGFVANKLKNQLNNLTEKKFNEFKNAEKRLLFDLTLPGGKVKVGHLHPLTLVQNRIIDIFHGINFSVVEGPEVEHEFYNFESLNFPKDHPARDTHDTIWLKPKEEGWLMRTHTSPVQIHYMKKNQPPFQVLMPGRVFRYEAVDFSHEFNFHQVEGLAVDRRVTMATLKYTIVEFFKKFFSKNISVRFRPSFFPFTEPSVEVDIDMPGRGWLEVAGAGMVHPNVFKAAGYNPADVQGFAFGFGLERLAMIKYNIPDIRLFHSGDLRFIHQF